MILNKFWLVIEPLEHQYYYTTYYQQVNKTLVKHTIVLVKMVL